LKREAGVPAGGARPEDESEAQYDELALTGFAELFGIVPHQLPGACQEMIRDRDFRYRVLKGDERDSVLVDVTKKIDTGQLSVAGAEGKPRWDKGWSETLRVFLEEGHDVAELRPKYIRPGQPLRLNQQYVISADPEFEASWYEVFRLWLFKTFLRDVDAVYEFGCGSGFNLAVLAALYPEKELHGLDWAVSSKEIVDEMGKVFGWNMRGHVFDFFNPDRSLKIADNSAVVTIGALEQTGRDYEAFLLYVLDSLPALVVHVEPIVEWYDAGDLVDDAAIKFHRKRQYWEGYPDRLRELEREGRVEILKAKRSFFGSLYIEGYSQLVWRPVARG